MLTPNRQRIEMTGAERSIIPMVARPPLTRRNPHSSRSADTASAPSESQNHKATIMRNLLLTGALILVTSISLSGAEFYEATKPTRQTNHLVPTPAPGDYENKIAKLLFLTYGRLGRMVVKPSFKAEYCLSVDGDISQHVPDEEKTFVITVTSASNSIYGSLLEKRRTNDDTDVGISRIDRKIGLELAVAIQRVWAKALLLTRYPSGPSNVLDGTTYEFSVWVYELGDLQGKTYAPERGLPADLVAIGSDLIDFVRQNARGKELTEQALIKRLKKLESKIPKANR